MVVDQQRSVLRGLQNNFKFKLGWLSNRKIAQPSFINILTEYKNANHIEEF